MLRGLPGEKLSGMPKYNYTGVGNEVTCTQAWTVYHIFTAILVQLWLNSVEALCPVSVANNGMYTIQAHALEGHLIRGFQYAKEIEFYQYTWIACVESITPTAYFHRIDSHRGGYTHGHV